MTPQPLELDVRPILRAGGPTAYAHITPESIFHLARPRGGAAQ